MHGLRSAFASTLKGCSDPKLFVDYTFWFIAEKLGSHFAVEGVEVSIKSSKSRQSLTSSGLEARRLENTSFGLIAFCLTSLVREAGHMEIIGKVTLH